MYDRRKKAHIEFSDQNNGMTVRNTIVPGVALMLFFCILMGLTLSALL